MRSALLLLLAGVITLVVVALGVALSTPSSVDSIKQQLEPYGGCDEAYLYPDTEGARLCEEMGR